MVTTACDLANRVLTSKNLSGHLQIRFFPSFLELKLNQSCYMIFDVIFHSRTVYILAAMDI